MLNFPINIIEMFFKNKFHKLRAPQLNIPYKKKYKSDIRNIFWRKVYHLTAKKYESRQWMAQIQHLKEYSVTTQNSLSELRNRFSLRSYTFSLFLTSLSCFCLSFVRKELGLHCCWDKILYMNWRTRRVVLLPWYLNKRTVSTEMALAL